MKALHNNNIYETLNLVTCYHFNTMANKVNAYEIYHEAWSVTSTELYYDNKLIIMKVFL